MSTKAAAPNRWFTGWRMVERAPLYDPADQGTAFGMEMSLDPAWDEAASAAAAAERPQGWVQRLTSRRRQVT